MSVHPARTNATEVAIPVGDVTLSGELVVPARAIGIVAFAHGSGSSRHSPRNHRVATTLNEAAIGTLLMDLLTPVEEQEDELTGKHRFDVDLLAGRVTGAIDWLAAEIDARLPIGLFGASTGAAGALVAASERPEMVAAVVSRGGRPDLAGSALRRVRAPTLLIVGGADDLVLQLNRRALAGLETDKRLEIVPGATHLFDEAGALEQVATLAADWFSRYLDGDDGDR